MCSSSTGKWLVLPRINATDAGPNLSDPRELTARSIQPSAMAIGDMGACSGDPPSCKHHGLSMLHKDQLVLQELSANHTETSKGRNRRRQSAVGEVARQSHHEWEREACRRLCSIVVHAIHNTTIEWAGCDPRLKRSVTLRSRPPRLSSLTRAFSSCIFLQKCGPMI